MKKIVFVLVVSFIAANTNPSHGQSGQTGIEAVNHKLLLGGASDNWYSFSIAMDGDLNGDGYNDIVIGAPGYDDKRGRVYIYAGGRTWSSIPLLVLTGAEIGGSFGSSVSTSGDLNGDGYDDLAVGAIGDESTTGKVFVYYGCAQLQSIAAVTLTGQGAGHYFGRASICADINGDGYSDLAVGAFGYQSNRGKVYLYLGGSSFDSSSDLTFTGENDGDKAGWFAAPAGDFNADGFGDIVIGAPDYSSFRGRAYVLFGGIVPDSIPDIVYTGNSASQMLGNSACSIGDMNGDGTDDIIIGVPGYGTPANTGRAYIYFGGIAPASAPSLQLAAESASGFFGASVAAAGDVNGDGCDDVLVGAYYFGAKGKAYLYLGGAIPDGNPDIRLNGSDNDSYFFGYTLAGNGDINGDGYPEFIVGEYAFNSNRGRAHLFSLSLTGIDIADETLLSTVDNSVFGGAVASAGDVNGDGYPDFIAGACGTNSNRGRAFVFFGGPVYDTIPDLTMDGENAGDYFGYQVASAGDVNADGYSDFMVSADQFNSLTGKVYIYFGGPTVDAVPDGAIESPNPSVRFGFSIAASGDVNGDGFGDIIIGAPGYSSWTGRAYIYYGGTTVDPTYDVALEGSGAGAYFGHHVSGNGDSNGDGYADVAVCGPAKNSNTGYCQIFFGGSPMNAFPDITVNGEAAGDFFGFSSALSGDVNNDGYADLLVGASMRNAQTGNVYLYLGGFVPDTVVDIKFSGQQQGERFGNDLEFAGDVNGDGFTDIVITSPMNGYNPGKIEGYFGGPGIDNIPDFTLQGLDRFSGFGANVSGAGDLNKDGYADILAGAPMFNNRGAVLLYQSSCPITIPRISQIKDVPGDEGGYVTLSFLRSGYDITGSARISSYNIFRSNPPVRGRFYWEQIGTVSPAKLPSYSFTASTSYDSTANVSGTLYFKIIATSTNPNEFWTSNILSGKSIDNLAPTAVKNFSGSPIGMTNRLAWKANTEPDMHSYAVYRSEQSSIDPNVVPPLATITDTVLTDNTLPVGDSYYFIRAKDIHGNYGVLSNLAAPLGMREVAVTALVEGLYDENTNTMVQDTVTVELRQGSSPYARVEQSQTFLSSTGAGAVRVRAAENTGNYYVVVKHRNAIETWSKQPQTMTDSRIQYDFTAAATTAYNDNLRQKGSKWCIFSGDVNQDGIVDYTDLSAIDNASFNYTGGYVATDLTGDEFVDYTDLTIADNNNFNYVSVQSPLALLKKGATAQADNTGVPVEYEVSRNYPNPFNPSTRINYALPQDSRVVVTLFNMLGERIATLIDKEESAGYHTAMIQMNGLPSGAYILHFTAGDYRKVQKIMLMK